MEIPNLPVEQSVSCSSCKFWRGERMTAKPVNGPCMRFPAQIAGMISQEGLDGKPRPSPISAFPTTHANAWCGEWKLNLKVAQ